MTTVVDKIKKLRTDLNNYGTSGTEYVLENNSLILDERAFLPSLWSKFWADQTQAKK